MATTSTDSATPIGTPENDSIKKKTRLNPARRKAAAKANADAPKVSVDNSAPATITSASLAKKLDKPNVPAVQSSQIKKQPTKPAMLPRQNTEPVVTTAGPGASARKPALQRTITAPEPAINNGKALGFKAPAIVTGGLVGCAAGAAILLGVSIWYDFSGVESAIITARSAKLCVDNLTDELITSLKVGTYSGDEALDMLRRTTLAYASTIPEGAPFVERIFREINMVRKQRGREIDKVVAETYTELSKAGIRGATSAEMRSIVIGQLTKLSKFASKATQDVITRNPKLRPYRDEAAKALNGPATSKTPTVRVNMAVRHKLPG